LVRHGHEINESSLPVDTFLQHVPAQCDHAFDVSHDGRICITPKPRGISSFFMVAQCLGSAMYNHFGVSHRKWQGQLGALHEKSSKALIEVKSLTETWELAD